MKKKIICRVDSINKKVNTVSTSAKFEESILAVLFDLYRSESKNLYHLTSFSESIRSYDSGPCP